MKRFEIALKILPILLLFSAACSFASGAKGKVMQNKNTFYTISAQEAKKRMDSGRPVVIVDVRTKSEYDGGHIPNAVLIPNETIGSERPASLPDLNAEILVCWRSGARSRAASQKLANLGYTSSDKFGGIMDWPYETVKTAR